MKTPILKIFLLFVLFLVIVLIVYKLELIQQANLTGLTIYTKLVSEPAPTPIIPNFNLTEIFDNNHSWVKNLPSDQIITLIATGDVIPARMVNVQTTKLDDFNWPYLKTAQFLKSSDITFINLETPLFPNCPIITSGFTFCGEDKNVQGLTFAGVDVASLANNHAGNFGPKMVDETAKLLEDNGILATGINGPVYKQVKGVKMAFLGFNDIGGKQPEIDFADEASVSAQIKEAKQNSDLVIVTFHWGIEYQPQPSPKQVELGHLSIDSGADLVIGNHPHWIQPVEFYKGKLITYAHGNFVFDQTWSQKTQEGVLGKYTFYQKKLVDVEYFPIRIQGYGQPYFYIGSDKQKILDDLKTQSEILATSSAVLYK